MAKEPEDKHGASSAGGEDDQPESNLPKDDSSNESSGQSELPLGDTPEEGDSESEFPKTDFPQSEFKEAPEEAESVHDDQAEDPHHTGELDSDHNDPHYDDPYHDEYHHDYHEEHHDEYHDEHAGDDGGYYGGGDDDEGAGEEGFGGPIKPFLDHLEDFRFMVMKCVVAVVVGMIVALIGSPQIVAFLTVPLESAQQKPQVNKDPKTRAIPVQFGSGIVSHIHESDLTQLAENGDLKGPFTNTTEITAIRLVPRPHLDANSSRFELELQVDNNSSASVPWHVQLKAYGPLKSFFIALKIGLYGGITISIPFVLFFIAQFVLPALRVNEKNWVFKLAGMGTVLFMLGVTFCYKIIMWVALWASVGFAGMLGFGADEWQAEEYIGFVCKFMVGMGIAFQMPMVLLFLVKIGILDYRKLNRLRMYAVVANIILAAVITPTGDPVTLSLVAVPLQLLYELSTLIAWIMARRQAEEEADFDAGDD